MPKKRKNRATRKPQPQPQAVTTESVEPNPPLLNLERLILPFFDPYLHKCIYSVLLQEKKLIFDYIDYLQEWFVELAKQPDKEIPDYSKLNLFLIRTFNDNYYVILTKTGKTIDDTKVVGYKIEPELGTVSNLEDVTVVNNQIYLNELSVFTITLSISNLIISYVFNGLEEYLNEKAKTRNNNMPVEK